MRALPAFQKLAQAAPARIEGRAEEEEGYIGSYVLFSHGIVEMSKSK